MMLLDHLTKRGFCARSGEASASVVGSPAKGCCGLNPDICRMFGVRSCVSQLVPRSDCRVPSSCESTEGPVACARVCAAWVAAITAGSRVPDGKPFSAALDRSIELRRDWISCVLRTLGEYLAVLSLSPLTHWLRYCPFAICWLEIS